MESDKRFTVRLPDAGVSFQAPESATVLAAARDAGVSMLSSCRNGTCRACIARLGEGRVTYRIEWPGLSAEEKVDGYFLPCVAYPASDLVVSALGVD
jgi:ferredoxin